MAFQVRKLERELGQELLDRSGRAVRPTEAGAAVLPYARRALEAVAGARQVVDELAGLLRGQVAVGMIATSSTAEIDLPHLIAGFHDDGSGGERARDTVRRSGTSLPRDAPQRLG